MFIIKTVKIIDDGNEILNVKLSNDDIGEFEFNNYTTLVLGENGVGKSFLLKSLIDIFIFLKNYKIHKRKPKYQYDSFYIEYMINNTCYTVHRVSGSNVIVTRDSLVIEDKNFELPEKVLAIAFMVNDKFQFSKENEDDMYVYHGVRTSTNSTYTSSITRNITSDLINSIEKDLYKQIAEVFSILNFDSKIEFECKMNKKTVRKTIDLNSTKKYSFEDFNKFDLPTIYFYKNNRRISFDSCSSGEKHILFAYLGILSRIKDGTLILIDEPEISLHPEWQIRYISTLNKLFNKYRNCCFVLASHSHYFV